MQRAVWAGLQLIDHGSELGDVFRAATDAFDWTWMKGLVWVPIEGWGAAVWERSPLPGHATSTSM